MNNLKKEDNVNLIHIGVCVVLEPFGYYRFDYYDDSGWPHFELIEALPHLKPGEQNLLIKGAIVDYFVKQGVIFLKLLYFCQMIDRVKRIFRTSPSLFKFGCSRDWKHFGLAMQEKKEF